MIMSFRSGQKEIYPRKLQW